MAPLIVQLLVHTNVPVLEDAEEAIWLDTSYQSVEHAKADWPLETYRLVEVKE